MKEKEMDNSDGENMNLPMNKFSRFLKYKNKSSNKFLISRKSLMKQE